MKRVQISINEFNYLKDDGTYLLNEHVYDCFYFNKIVIIVQYKNYTWNIVNSNGYTLLRNNVKYCYINDKQFIKIRINDIWYKLDKECNFYNDDEISFKELYNNYPNKRQELIEIIEKYTYYNTEEYFI